MSDTAEQYSEEWWAARLGIPTASMMGNIITPTGKASTSAETYMNQLLADWFAGHPVDQWKGNKFTEIGHEREADTRALYAFLTDNEVTETGFHTKGDMLVGCSPDGLVGDSGMVEFKNPKGSTVIGYLLSNKMPGQYIPQVQSSLWILEREWCDFMYSHPDITHKVIRVHRDEKYIETLAGLTAGFISKMLEKRALLEKYRAAAP